MKKAIILGGILVIAAMANAIAAEDTSEEQVIRQGNVTVTPLNRALSTVGDGNIQISDSEEDDLQPTIARSPSGRVVAAYATRQSILQQPITLAYSEDGSSWTQAAEFSSDTGILQYPAAVGIDEAGDIGFTYIDPLAEFPFTFFRIGDVTQSDTYNGVSYVWSDTEDYQEAAITYVHELAVPMFTLHNYYLSEIEGCPFICYFLPSLEFPTEIGGQYFDGQSILRTAPASNIALATGEDYFYLLFEHANQTTGHSEIAFKKTVTDLELLYTAGGGPDGMDKYADLEAMPWQQYLAKGDFDAKDPDVAASGDNVVVVYMSNDNVYGDWNIDCWYSSDSGETWDVSTVAGQGQIDENYPAVFMSGSNVYCIYEKEGNLYSAESGDGGATWEDPIQINEEAGTVVSEARAIDVSRGGIVWTDTRNGNEDIYYAPLPVPLLDVESIAGGFGVSATITNSGTVAAENVDWSVELSGAVFVGASTSDTIDQLEPGDSVTVGPGFVLGVGPTTITVSAGGSSSSASGFILGPFVLGL